MIVNKPVFLNSRIRVVNLKFARAFVLLHVQVASALIE